MPEQGPSRCKGCGHRVDVHGATGACWVALDRGGKLAGFHHPLAPMPAGLVQCACPGLRADAEPAELDADLEPEVVDEDEDLVIN